ncbi:MAG: acetyl-CoA carboxylase carboxyl transferase subunit alpha/beta, partial [Mailhella sp.]|nr:acetyl-CoA carboxylase carboxyl transferase subunit alpha/beta [Mailhella sp.]
MTDWEKQLQQLSNRLHYLSDIFPGKHEEDISLLTERLALLRQEHEGNPDLDIKSRISSLEDLFFFTECKLEDKLTPMDKVRIVRHPQRICLRDILENVYDDFTEIGGQGEHTNDPAMVIARAYITRHRKGAAYHQPVLVIGHEKGHGEEFRNGGSAKPWGNAKAKHYMGVAETEGIPIHTFVFTPGGYPLEEYPGAAQQIARNIYEMAGLTVPVIAVISEGGSGGAEAIALADRRLMLSHGYYSVISPEGAAAIEGHPGPGERVPGELVERCADNLRLTAEDNLEFGYVDGIIQEPILG